MGNAENGWGARSRLPCFGGVVEALGKEKGLEKFLELRDEVETLFQTKK